MARRGIKEETVVVRRHKKKICETLSGRMESKGNVFSFNLGG